MSFSSSPVFRFVVGPHRTEYTIHSSLVAKQSAKLDVLVNGPMKEATDLCADWSETEEQTFLRFCDFVYTGSYEEGSPRKKPVKENTPEQKKTEEIGEAETPKSTIRRKSKHTSSNTADFVQSKADELWAKFTSLYPPTPLKNTSFRNEPEDDCTEIFLSHARMYVFADYHGIDTLPLFALQKLRGALTRFVLHDESCVDIAELVTYTFGSTVDNGDDVDPLRSLVCFYAACRIEQLWRNSGFKNNVESISDFLTHLITLLLQRLD
ncbi:hypothetical protein MANI_024468 [Metarhizium anisopliae]